MTNTLKALLALVLLAVLTFMACSCQTLKRNWPHAKEVAVVEGKEAIEDIVNTPTPGNAAAEGVEWLFQFLYALLIGGGAAVGYTGARAGVKRLSKDKETASAE